MSPEIDVDLALHCLEDLGGRTCPIVKQRTEALHPVDSEACGGLSIRDSLWEWLLEAQRELNKSVKKKRAIGMARASGEVDALAYAIALMDNPYRPDFEGIREAAREECR